MGAHLIDMLKLRGELKISQFEERKSNLLGSSVHHNLNLFVYFQL